MCLAQIVEPLDDFIVQLDGRHVVQYRKQAIIAQVRYKGTGHPRAVLRPSPLGWSAEVLPIGAPGAVQVSSLSRSE